MSLRWEESWNSGPKSELFLKNQKAIQPEIARGSLKSWPDPSKGSRQTITSWKPDWGTTKTPFTAIHSLSFCPTHSHQKVWYVKPHVFYLSVAGSSRCRLGRFEGAGLCWHGVGLPGRICLRAVVHSVEGRLSSHFEWFGHVNMNHWVQLITQWLRRLGKAWWAPQGFATPWIQKSDPWKRHAEQCIF